jgi:DNA modification methylase
MPKEFISKLEEILPAEELLFEPTPSFGKYKIFLEHAVAHPAKANTELLEFLILKFTKPGDVILDPMAGSGFNWCCCSFTWEKRYTSGTGKTLLQLDGEG